MPCNGYTGKYRFVDPCKTQYEQNKGIGCTLLCLWTSHHLASRQIGLHGMKLDWKCDFRKKCAAREVRHGLAVRRTRSSACKHIAACCTVDGVGSAVQASPRKVDRLLRTAVDGSTCMHEQGMQDGPNVRSAQVTEPNTACQHVSECSCRCARKPMATFAYEHKRL